MITKTPVHQPDTNSFVEERQLQYVQKLNLCHVPDNNLRLSLENRLTREGGHLSLDGTNDE